MSRSTRDVLYRIYVIVHIFPSILLALPAVLPSSIVPAACLKPLQWYLSTYNDPLAGKKSFPGGWFGGFSVCEVLLQLPYFFWAATVPIGSIEILGQANDLGDKRLDLPSLAYAIHATTTIFAAICELFAFPETVINTSEKITLGMSYIPFQIMTGIMAIDMYKRVRRRIEAPQKQD
jgi:hypothetical protein